MICWCYLGMYPILSKKPLKLKFIRNMYFVMCDVIKKWFKILKNSYLFILDFLSLIEIIEIENIIPRIIIKLNPGIPGTGVVNVNAIGPV